MYDLFSFYRSDKWRALVEALKLERLNDDGQLICEYCGRPIVRAYDAIGHHKEPLTEDNVNDVSISLNPSNIMIIHHKCHNVIHDRLGIKYERRVFLVYGAPLAGKTTWVRDNMQAGDLVVDIDNIWQAVSGCDRYTKPKRLNAVVFKVRDTLLDCVRYRLGHWLNAYIVGGYPLISERERLCKELGAQEVFIESSREECLNRLDNTNDGRDRDEWRGYIDRWYDTFTPPR